MNPDQSTKVKFGDDATTALMKGVNLVCDATTTTLGPLGKNSVIDFGYKIGVQHDGVITAEAVNPKEPFASLGARIIKEAAKKQRDSVGDGTTLVTILSQYILKEAFKYTSIKRGDDEGLLSYLIRRLKALTVNPMTLRKGLERGCTKVIKEITKLSVPIKRLDQKVAVATISAEDKELGKMIAETIHKIGNDGVIVVEESKMPDTIVEKQDGMQFDKGYAHQFMITEAERMTAVLEDVHVLISDIPLNNLAEIGKFLETQVLAKGVVKMVFIAPEVGGDFLSALLGAKINGKFIGLVVKNPMVGSHATDFLQDLCAMTGAKLVSKEAGHKFQDIDLTWCGKIGRIVSTKLSTTITNGGGLKADVLQRIATIKKQMEDTDLSDFDKEKLKERLAKLTSGVAVVKVGGETEVEMKERKERAIDAVSATQSAVKHGIVPGGEVIFLKVANVLDKTDLGEKILYDALYSPFRKLVTNAGFNYKKMIKQFEKNPELGLDVTDGVWKDMVKNDIIDPTEVSTTAVKTALSVAVSLLTAGVSIVPDKDDEKK